MTKMNHSKILTVAFIILGSSYASFCRADIFSDEAIALMNPITRQLALQVNNEEDLIDLLDFLETPEQQADYMDMIVQRGFRGQTSQNITMYSLENIMLQLVPNRLSSDEDQPEKKSFYALAPSLKYFKNAANNQKNNDYFKGYTLAGSFSYFHSNYDDDADYVGSIGRKTNSTLESASFYHNLNKNLVIGAQFSFSNTHTKQNPSNFDLAKSKNNTTSYGIFSSYRSPNVKYPYYMNSCVSYAKDKLRSTDTQAFNPMSIFITESDISRNIWTSLLEFGWTINEPNIGFIQPYFKASLTHTHQDAYSEVCKFNGVVQNWGLNFNIFESTNWSHGLGMQISRSHKIFGNEKSQISARFGVTTQKVAGKNSTLEFSFQGWPSNFTVDIPNKRRYFFDMSLDFFTKITNNLSSYGQYTGNFNHYTTNHYLALGLMYTI